jgi:DNA-binding MarR family transcriptional regulator
MYMGIESDIQQSKFRNTRQKALINLIYTSNWLLTKQQHFLKAYGITTHQFNILRILRGQHPKSISGTAIKSRMLDQNSDVSRLLDRLAAKKLISKSACPNDKRAVDVSITEDGLSLLANIDKQEKVMDSILHLTEEEAAQLSDLLDKARD